MHTSDPLRKYTYLQLSGVLLIVKVGESVDKVIEDPERQDKEKVNGGGGLCL